MSGSTQQPPGSSSSSPRAARNPSPTLSSLLNTPKLERFQRERDALLSSSSYYELLQLYKTHIYRASAKRDSSLSSLLAFDGAKILLDRGQGNAGGELAVTLLDTYSKQQLAPSPPLLTAILSLFWAFPDDARAPRLSFMKAAIRWSVGERTRKHGHPDLHLSLARFHAALRPSPASAERDYADAHLHYLLAASASTADALEFGSDVPKTYRPPPLARPASSSPPEQFDTYSEHASLVLEWASQGTASELPLFIVRGCLQYLALGDLRGANALLDVAMTRMDAARSREVSEDPLVHFVQFLMRTCERDAGQLFDVLRAKYEPALKRDDGFDALLDRVGEVFFHREAKKSWIDSLLG